ncbi:DNA polymerase [Paramuricea clavata]|uniref:DNA-directed DNA polymerase n=1 Tax=Paramuricea clavata TaxID=317549 RepID=A0A7D9D9V9_PARCT|nr:DNA polymerase [Paramuricea clavata]
MSLELEERNLKLIDSYLFLSMRLAKFPEALGIENMAKGYHPYLFTDLNYVGDMVGLEYFELPPEGSKERKAFDKWYKQQQSKRMFFASTQRLSRTFRQAGYTVIEKWECDYRNDVDMTPYRLKQLQLTSFFEFIQLEPRDALFGGRTSSATLYYDMKHSGLPAMYFDVCSLYPYVQKKFEYPTQHPVILHGLACQNIDVNHVFGLIKCKILPPTHLLFPVLPFRSEKLTFPLCRTCVLRQQRDRCDHNDEQRALYGTWTSIEIQKALQLDYHILIVYEIYHYEKREKIFDQYVNTFIKLKQESSGVPKKCLDKDGAVVKEKLQKYIDDYLKHEGVLLESDKMCYNAGQRTVMKALLNSLWGKLAQNENVTVVSFLESMDDLLELVNDRTVDVTSLDFISGNIARTTHRKTASLTPLPNRNVIIASFVTAYSRLELLVYLLKLGSNVLYYDTDSVIFIEDRANGKYLETSEYLGQMTDELVEKKTSTKWIEQFCSAGPKSYSYRTNVYTRYNDDGSESKQ